MLRFRPALAATLRPGSSTVPDAELVMLVIARSSTAITSQVSTRWRAVWWWSRGADSRAYAAVWRASVLRGGGYPTRPGKRRRSAALRLAHPRSQPGPRVAHDLTVGGGHKPGDSDVQTDLPTCGRQRRGLLLGDDDDIPPAPLALAPQRLHPADDLPVGLYLHLPNTLEVGRGPPALHGAPAGTVTVHEVDRIPAVTCF